MMGINPPTAYLLLTDIVKLPRGSWVIQNGANSGVGRATVAIAKALGLRTMTVVRRNAVVAEMKALGGDVVFEVLVALDELGLKVEGFGGDTLRLSSYPALLGERSPKAVLQAIIDYVLSKERVPSCEQLLNDLLSLMGCHAAIRAGDRLTPEAIAELLTQREVALNSHHCPHGRPTSIRFSRHDLERHFKRI